MFDKSVIEHRCHSARLEYDLFTRRATAEKGCNRGK